MHCKHTISFLMRLTQLSIFLYVLAIPRAAHYEILMSNMVALILSSAYVHLSPLRSLRDLSSVLLQQVDKFILWKTLFTGE